MGKRTRSVNKGYESIANKIRKLEQKLTRTRRRDRQRTPRSTRLSSSSSGSSSDTSESSSRSRSASGSRSPPPDALCNEGVPIPVTSASTVNVSETAPIASTSAAAAAELPSASVAPQPDTAAPTTSDGIAMSSSSADPTPVLDPDLLLILGEDPTQAKAYGEPIQPDLAVRLQHIARTGLPKEVRKELKDRYLPPVNCTLIEAPILNPEVIAAIPETVLRRDKSIELQQKQRSSTIACVAEALTLLMSSEPKNTTLIRMLMDSMKLMCDSQNMDSNLRRNFILSCLKKDLKDQLHATKIDKLLFSEDLAGTLKAAKAISKSGADMKPTHSLKQERTQKNKPPQKHLNWRAPPQNHRLKGTQRTKEPAGEDRPASSSKPSSRPAHRSRNRR